MNICVYCSASNKIPEHYKLQAAELGKWIATNGHTLVFGGATGGLMTAVSEAAASHSGEIIGIIPEQIIAAGRESKVVTQQILTSSMNERKAQLKAMSDVFVALPGSYGTLDEVFDVVASGTVGEHSKPLILVNEQGFYNDLVAQIERMKQEFFIPQNEHYKLQIVDDIQSGILILGKLR